MLSGRVGRGGSKRGVIQKELDVILHSVQGPFASSDTFIIVAAGANNRKQGRDECIVLRKISKYAPQLINLSSGVSEVHD